MKISQNLVATENQGRDKKWYWGQEKNVATRDRMRRQRKSFKEGSCRDIVLYVVTLKEDNSYRDRKTMSQQGMIAS